MLWGVHPTRLFFGYLPFSLFQRVVHAGGDRLLESIEHPARAAVSEQFGVACPGHHGAHDSLWPLVWKGQRELTENGGFINLVARGLLQHLHNEIEDEQASKRSVEQLLALVDVGGEKLLAFRRHFNPPARGRDPDRKSTRLN